MAIVTIRGQRGSGGGGGVNYSVVGGTVQPASPKENMIWVNTAVALGDIQSNCVSVPTTRSDGTALRAGDVYIAVLTTTTVPFNALKKNGLLCLPGTCYQYDGSAWNPKDAYIYQSGAWAELPGLPPVGTSFNDCSWEQIDRIGAAGKESEYFTVGETKTVTLTTSESIQFRIVGMRHDLLADGSGQYAPLSLHMVNCLQSTGPMEGSKINTNGWNGCAMRNTCNTTYYGMLPDALQAVVKRVQKKASVGNQSATIVTSLDKVWLAAEIEIFGTTAYAKTGEGNQYAYYTNNSVRIKNVAGAASLWWERSPGGGNATTFCYVNSSGAATTDYASNSYGVALGLCV